MAQPTPYMPLDARYTTLSDLEPEELIVGNMPSWLSGPRATPEIIQALNKAMGLSRDYHEKVGKQFGELQSVEKYCGNLLEAELSRQFGKALHVHDDYLVLAHEQFVSENSLLMTLEYKITYDSPKTLLWSALQNFAYDETINQFTHFRKGSHPEHLKGVDPCDFVEMCRTLDLGGCYQTYLQHFLKVAVPGSETLSSEQAATHSSLELLKAYDLEVDAHVAFLRNNISETAYTALISLVAKTTESAPAARVMLEGNNIVYSALSILDTVVDGVVVFSGNSLLMHPTQRLIAYIPNDPVSPLQEYPSLHAFIDALKIRLSQPAYVEFFSRYIALSAKPSFLSALTSMPAALALTATPVKMTVPRYLVASHLKKMFADAQLLAVPTAVVDARERERKWQLFKSAGLFLVNAASLFVPQLGALMLGVAVVEMLAEVYEGVDDWAHGDRDHARTHLLNVANDLALAAATVVGAAVVKKAAVSLSSAVKAYVSKFEPIMLDDGTERLWAPKLEHYQYTGAVPPHAVADELGFFTIHGKKYVEMDGKKYPVEFDDAIKQWRIPHPKRKAGYKPALLHNREGTWQCAHERPLEWQGSATLIARLGATTARFDELTLSRIMQVSNTSQDVLREMYLENLPVPPLLKVTVKRFEMDTHINSFIEHMGKSEHGAAHFADLQLSMLPLLPGWPVGKDISLLDTSGTVVKAHYSNPLWTAVQSNLEVLPSVPAQGKLLETLIEALSEQERQTLIGAHAAEPSEAAKVLSQQLATYARNHRTEVFERLYARFNRPKSAAVESIQAVFPSLPRVVAEELVTSASVSDSESLALNKVPLGMAERARSLLQEARLNRAFEGFYLDCIDAEDTEALIRNYLPRLKGWPMASAFEIREGSLSGSVTRSFGAVGQAPVRVLVSTTQGYQRYSLEGEVYILEPDEAGMPFSSAVFKSLTASERHVLGFPELADMPRFNAALADLAIEARAESFQVLGMQPIKPTFKPPVRMLGARIGYPLCGLDSGTYPASLRRRVRNIYRRFNSERVDLYLDSLVERGLDPLAVLRKLKRDKHQICTTLQNWLDRRQIPTLPAAQAETRSENEFQVCVLIMRAWYKNPEQVSWISEAESSNLSLDGVRLSELPPLPDGADFRHIHNLNLNNMRFSRNLDAFLAHFPNVKTLELDNNLLEELPSRLSHMPHLARLSLVHNRIVLNEDNTWLLRTLTRMETLNLSHNPLGNEVSFNGMPYLRHVFLRNTGIPQWPRHLITRPFLEMADLRDNQITEIPPEVYHVSSSILQNISLTGNPLSAASRLRLARFVMQGGRSMGVRSEELLSEAAAFDFWTAGITNSELARRARLWSDLSTDPTASDFFNVLSRLVVTSDAQSIRHDMTRRVWEIIEAIHDNESVRLDILDLAAMPRSCADSVTMTFSALEQQMQLSKIALNPLTEESALLAFAKQLFRIDQLGRIATEDFNARLNVPGPVPDELEIHLAYRIGLANELELVNQPQSMLFNTVAGVTQTDLQRAYTEIKLLEQTPALVRFISTRDFWTKHLVTAHMSEMTELTEPYFNQLSQLLRQSPDMTSERYLRRVSEIRDEQDHAIAAWCLAKTQSILPMPGPSFASSPGSIQTPSGV